MAAISPFNFTAIGGNLAGAPALMVRSREQWELVMSQISNQHSPCLQAWEKRRW